MTEVLRPKDLLQKRRGSTICLYGPPGAGKTTLASTAEEPLILCTDPQGADVLLGTDTPIILIENLQEMEAVINKLETGRIKEGRTVFWDTISSSQTLDLFTQRQGLQGREKASQNEFALSNQRMTDILLKLLTRLPKRHIVVVAHQRIERNSEGNITGYLPDMQPGTWAAVNKWFSGVFYYQIVQSKPDIVRKLYTASGFKATTKCRYGIRPEFVNPKWSDVQNAINAWYNSHSTNTKEAIADD